MFAHSDLDSDLGEGVIPVFSMCDHSDIYVSLSAEMSR